MSRLDRLEHRACFGAGSRRCRATLVSGNIALHRLSIIAAPSIQLAHGARVSLPPNSGLDQVFPYGPDDPTSPNATFTAGTIFQGDTPDANIAKGGTTTSNKSFTTWLMCKPASGTGCWVPLSKIDWSIHIDGVWAANSAIPVALPTSVYKTPAQKFFDAKILNPNNSRDIPFPGPPFKYTGYSFSDTLTFPTWSKKLDEGSFGWSK